MLGCGNSTLSSDMARDGYTNITSMYTLLKAEEVAAPGLQGNTVAYRPRLLGCPDRKDAAAASRDGLASHGRARAGAAMRGTGREGVMGRGAGQGDDGCPHGRKRVGMGPIGHGSRQYPSRDRWRPGVSGTCPSLHSLLTASPAEQIAASFDGRLHLSDLDAKALSGAAPVEKRLDSRNKDAGRHLSLLFVHWAQALMLSTSDAFAATARPFELAESLCRP